MIRPLRLPERTLVPVESEPAEVLEYPILGSLLMTVDIGILDSEDQAAAGRPGGQPVEQGGPGVAEMKRPGG